MSEPENFLTRWSRRKLVAEEPAPPAAADAAPDKTPADGEPASEPAAKSAAKSAAKTAEPPAPAFDPASLPSLDSIGAQTDISAFLKPGVPGDLRLAALRRAWSMDPAIRDFKGLAENDWDFTVPNATMGFGEIDPGLDVKKMLAQVFGETPRAQEPAPELPAAVEQSTPQPKELSSPAERVANSVGESPHDSEIAEPVRTELAGNDDMVHRDKNIAAHDQESELDAQADDAPSKRRRSQGRALPQ